ncbi:unnamed protein product, partial [Staurois parvus]
MIQEMVRDCKHDTRDSQRTNTNTCVIYQQGVQVQHLAMLTSKVHVRWSETAD